MSNLCTVCERKLPADGDYVKCAINNCKLHYDCANLARKTYQQMGQNKRDTYKCILCRNNDGIIPADFFMKMENKVEEIVRNSLHKQTEIFNEQINEMKKLLDFTSAKYEDIIQENKSIRDKLTKLEENEAKLIKNCDKLNSEIMEMKLQIEEREQYDRNRNIIIEGIPETKEENVYNIFNNLAVLIDEPITLNEDIQAAHRIPTKHSDRPKPIVVQFTNRQKRDAVVKKAKKKLLKTTDFVSRVPVCSVYINDHLTPYYKKLLYEAKKLKTEKDFKYVWVSNSKIFVRKDDNSITERIRSTTCIQKFYN